MMLCLQVAGSEVRVNDSQSQCMGIVLAAVALVAVALAVFSIVAGVAASA